ncbi:hypothetical protein PV433_10450 [Paenibacillus sp. GYB004]|uniref:hypothetical protein n=1 Tax=Paenibacillus sp. GYB004 TaxID=2994393 RepID=UPI002F96E07B
MEQTKCYVLDLRQLRKETKRRVMSKDTALKVSGITIALLAIPATAMAAGTGIDAGAEKIYGKVINVGKWVIVVKGAIDTIKSVAEGDMGSAKRNFLGYVVTYMILGALPIALNEVDKLFESLRSPS